MNYLTRIVHSSPYKTFFRTENYKVYPYGNTMPMMIPFCVDVDECVVNNGGCEQLCINQLGSRSCACLNGYQISPFFPDRCDGRVYFTPIFLSLQYA